MMLLMLLLLLPLFIVRYVAACNAAAASIIHSFNLLLSVLFLLRLLRFTLFDALWIFELLQYRSFISIEVLMLQSHHNKQY